MSGSQFKILIIDADANFRMNLGSELKSNGYQVSLASCGNKTFELFPEMFFDLIVADAGMPNGNGLELIQTLSTKKIQIPVFLTSGDQAADSNAMKAAGAADFLHKPLTGRDLMERIRRILGLPTSFSYFINRKRAIVVVSWLGELGVVDAEALARCSQEIVSAQSKFVVLNLHGFTGYDAVLAGEIVAFQQKIRDSGATLILCGFEWTVREQMASKGLVVEAEILPALKDALQFILEFGTK